MANQHLEALHHAGVSIWLDDLSRHRITSGELARQITESSVTGVTTNPTIFAAAFKDMSAYGDQLASLKGRPTDQIIRELMAADVKSACQIFRPTFDATHGVDGRVSIEVEPGLAHDAAATTAQAAELYAMVDEPNVLIKIPATVEGLQAIEDTIAAGISVNVTLIFSLDRYAAVIDSYFTGLQRALEAGKDISQIHSVASFFVSRVDTEVDKRLSAIGAPEALAMRGQAAVANARMAYDTFLMTFTGSRYLELQRHGANLQRPLWASTGTKNPDYPDTLYVSSLIARYCVNTMPQQTLEAFADHGVVEPDTITTHIEDARDVLAALANCGLSYDDVTSWLEADGVAKFVASWQDLVAATQATGGE